MGMLFFIAVTLLLYTYVGYAVHLWIYDKIRRIPILKINSTPTVSIIIAARNEESTLASKIENIQHLNYPQDKIQIIIVSDGSTDGTASLLQRYSKDFCLVILDVPCGKAYALNEAVRHATGEILVFLDARQHVDINAIKELTSCFADSTVGAVSGELLLESQTGIQLSNALGIYWKLEKLIRKLESSTGSAIGVTGAIHAIRSELYIEIPQWTILDDVYIPMNVARQGKRVIFQETAIARDFIFTDNGKEFSRKVRTLTGNYQLLKISPWILSLGNPLLFRFISHKILRLIAPVFLVFILVTTLIVKKGFYHDLLAVQIVFYALAATGIAIPEMRKFRLISIPNTFVMLNLAAVVAFYNFILGKNKVWVR